MHPAAPLLVAAIVALGWAFAPLAAAAAAAKQTVCTITVNSADEKEMFRRHLPGSEVEFVELVERDRPDWLASACRSAVRCDLLIVSGHYDGANEFFSDRLEAREFLPVAELERVSCSASCPGLFANLKEVHLYGCNTLNPDPQSSASAEVVRALVREGHAPGEAKRQLKTLTAAYGESSRDRMRQIFNSAPVIYGFSAAAPLGPVAASTLSRYFRAGGARELGRGHPSGRLLGYFAPFSLAVTQGMAPNDPHIDTRRDMCRFADERASDATRLGFVHELLQRPPGEARLYLDRMQHLMTSLDAPRRSVPAVAQALDAIARDGAARTRFLGFARALDTPGVRARFVDLAHDLGWLSNDERLRELARMLAELQARTRIDVADVDLACSLNRRHELDGALNRWIAPRSLLDDLPHAALRACLGSAEDHVRTLQALLSTAEADARIAQLYLRHRPIAHGIELRRLAADIVRMEAVDAQVRALESLARHYVTDGELLAMLVRLFERTGSAAVQGAIAGILLRAELPAGSRSLLAQTLLGHRLPPPGADSLGDALIEQLQAP
jgi:hypothetical protein